MDKKQEKKSKKIKVNNNSTTIVVWYIITKEVAFAIYSISNLIHVPLLCEYNTGSPIKLQYMCATKGAIRCPAKHKPLTNETKKKKATQTQENV